MATNKDRQLGKDFRLYVANIEEPESDSDYVKVTNENQLSVNWNANVQENSTKEEGPINNPGDETWELSFDFNDIFVDAGFTALKAARNKPWLYQIRYQDKVWLEGEFILSELEWSAESQDVRSGSGTLMKAGAVTESTPPRALVPTP